MKLECSYSALGTADIFGHTEMFQALISESVLFIFFTLLIVVLAAKQLVSLVS